MTEVKIIIDTALPLALSLYEYSNKQGHLDNELFEQIIGIYQFTEEQAVQEVANTPQYELNKNDGYWSIAEKEAA